MAAHAETVSSLWSRGYAVLPEPQQVELREGDVRFGRAWSLDRGAGVALGDVAAETLSEALQSRFGLRAAAGGGTAVRLAIRAGSVVPGQALDPDKQAIADEAYRLEIGDSGIAITANAAPGLFYGVETLVQLLRPRDGGVYLPQCRITDWPDLHLRHIYWDDAHHLERLPELKRAVRQAAFFKINGFALKLEGHFQFRSAPALVEPYALSPAEYQELTDYGLRYHVQVIPYLDGPAHIAFILKHLEYAKYRSFPESNYELCATNPEAVKFLSGMFQDLADANRGGKFIYLSTDEAYYIGMADNPACQEKAAAQKLGSVGKLLAQFVTQVAEPLHKQGRTVMFWGEFPLVVSDIESIPPYMVNGEVYGPDFDPVFHKRGIQQMIYTSTQGEERFFPDYFSLPNARRLHPGRPETGRVADGYQKIALDPAREQTDLIGAVVAGWADAGLHPETFWLGYASITAAGWRPGPRTAQESSAAFYKLFYGDGAVNMNRVYQLMSEQAQFWSDSWEQRPSSRIGLFGYSEGIYNPRKPVKDQTLTLPAGPDLKAAGDARKPSKGHEAEGGWRSDNARRLQLAADELADNDELLGLLEENLRGVQFNRYNLEVYISIAQLYRQNLEMLLGVGRMCSSVALAILAWCLLVAWQVVVGVYTDHQMLVADRQRLRETYRLSDASNKRLLSENGELSQRLKDHGLKAEKPITVQHTIVASAPNAVAIETANNPTFNTFGKVEPPARRLPPEVKQQMISALSHDVGKISISSIMNNPEAWGFATDFFEVFKTAGWTIDEDRIKSVMIAGRPWTGVQLQVTVPGIKSGEKADVHGQAAVVGSVLQDVFAVLHLEFAPVATPDGREGDVGLIVGPIRPSCLDNLCHDRRQVRLVVFGRKGVKRLSLIKALRLPRHFCVSSKSPNSDSTKALNSPPVSKSRTFGLLCASLLTG